MSGPSSLAWLSLPIWFDASPSLSVTGLMDRIRRVRRRLGDDGEPLVVICIPDLFLLGHGETLWGRADSSEHIVGALKVVARELDVPILAGVRILGEGDDGLISTELRMLEASVDRLAVLHRHWRDGREIHVELRGRRGNRGLTLWTTAEGGFSDRPDRAG